MAEIIGDLEELLSAMQNTALGDMRRLKHDAEQEAQSIRQEAKQRAQQARDQILQRADSEARAIQRRGRVNNRQDERRAFLQVREDVLQSIWEQAEERLKEEMADRDRYRDMLGDLALAAADVLGPGHWVLTSDENGHDLLTDKTLDSWADEAGERLDGDVSFGRDEEPADTWGGLLVLSEDRVCCVDLRFSTRLATARDEIRGQVLDELEAS